MNPGDELNRLVELLDELIVVSPYCDGETPPLAKIELLERALEAWRFYSKQPDSELSLERFLQCGIFVDSGRITFRLPEKERTLGAGTRPIRLQPPLLIFLLLYHRDQLGVFDIIRKFIDKIRGDLSILDFKRTRTGVMRCFTNTRFAALTLRNYGLLKFTHKEAFKTWVLSLPGIHQLEHPAGPFLGRRFEQEDGELGGHRQQPIFVPLLLVGGNPQHGPLAGQVDAEPRVAVAMSFMASSLRPDEPVLVGFG